MAASPRPISKVRIVKCPKCRQLLPEPEDLALYECGGCGTFLQAKIRRNDLKNAKPDSPKAAVFQSSEQGDEFQEQGFSSTTQNVTPGKTFKNSHIEPDTDQVDALNMPEEVSSLAHAESSVVVAENPEVEATETSCLNLKNSPPSGNLPKGDKPVNEHDASGLGVSPSHQQVDFFYKSTVDGCDLVRSIDSQRTNSSTELSDTIGTLSKSPSAGGTNAYDGSISSCDGIHEQVLKHLDQYRTTFGDEELLGAHEILRKGKFPINSKNQYFMNNNMRDPYEPSRDEHHMKLDDVGSPTVPFYLRNPQVGFENGSPSSHWHDEFKCKSTFCSPKNEARENLRLLRMVYDLQAKLDKTHLAREKTKQPRPNEVYHNLNCPTQRRVSGEDLDRRHQVDHSHLHCHPHHCQCVVHCYCCCNVPSCVHLCHNFCSVHKYCPSRFDKEMDKERYVNTGHSSQNPHARSKQQFVKRHFRPVASGAPFITCYHCLKPLQLPADCLLSKRKCYQLKCGVCSKVLNFSLQSNNHILPHAPCEVEETGRATKWRSSTYVPVGARKKRVLFDRNPEKVHGTAAGPSSNKFDTERRS